MSRGSSHLLYEQTVTVNTIGRKSFFWREVLDLVQIKQESCISIDILLAFKHSLEKQSSAEVPWALDSLPCLRVFFIFRLACRW